VALIARLIAIAILSAATFQWAVAQTATPTGNEPPVPAADFLHRHGIDSSTQSLAAALSNNDPTIRSLAAFQLAAAHPAEAGTMLENALANETNPEVAVQIASALWQIGDRIGFTHLESVCSDASLPMTLVTEATWYIAVANRSRPQSGALGKCAGTLVAGLGRAGERDEWGQIVERLPAIFRDVPKPEANVIVSSVQNLLEDHDPAIRMAASHALAEIASPASATFMQSAILREQDPTVRSSLERDLSTLEKKQPAK
jgi:hypothetical protein